MRCTICEKNPYLCSAHQTPVAGDVWINRWAGACTVLTVSRPGYVGGKYLVVLQWQKTGEVFHYLIAHLFETLENSDEPDKPIKRWWKASTDKP